MTPSWSRTYKERRAMEPESLILATQTERKTTLKMDHWPLEIEVSDFFLAEDVGYPAVRVEGETLSFSLTNGHARYQRLERSLSSSHTRFRLIEGALGDGNGGVTVYDSVDEVIHVDVRPADGEGETGLARSC